MARKQSVDGMVRSNSNSKSKTKEKEDSLNSSDIDSSKNDQEDAETSMNSASSWNTNDIAEERAQNSEKTKKMLIMCIVINGVLNLSLLGVYIGCAEDKDNKKGKCEFGEFASHSLNKAYFAISCLLWV